MKPSRLLSLLRNLSYASSFLVVSLALIIFFTGWIWKPFAIHPHHSNGINLWKFDLLGSVDGANYRGVRNDSMFFSSGEVTLNVGQEGTPAALITLSNWHVAGTSLLLLFPATILWLFGLLFGAIKKGESFSLQSVRRIRMMGWCFLAYFGIGTIFARVLFHQIAADFPSQQFGVNIFIQPQRPELNPEIALFGLFAFALAEVLRQGLLLKQENDLTV